MIIEILDIDNNEHQIVAIPVPVDNGIYYAYIGSNKVNFTCDVLDDGVEIIEDHFLFAVKNPIFHEVDLALELTQYKSLI